VAQRDLLAKQKHRFNEVNSMTVVVNDSVDSIKGIVAEVGYCLVKGVENHGERLDKNRAYRKVLTKGKFHSLFCSEKNMDFNREYCKSSESLVQSMHPLYDYLIGTGGNIINESVMVIGDKAHVQGLHADSGENTGGYSIIQAVTSGFVRVIPLSHKFQKSMNTAEVVDMINPEYVYLEAGDILVLHDLLIHSGTKPIENSIELKLFCQYRPECVESSTTKEKDDKTFLAEHLFRDRTILKKLKEYTYA
jgi:hypothetical protein